MRKFCFFIFSFIFCGFAFAEYKTVDTKYFSFVYDDAVSTESARILVNKADSIAEEIFQYFNIKPFKSKLPVLLKPNEESLNGYYTSDPYKHIVIYDTLPTDNIISNYEESLISVFKHEFTHAVNVRNILHRTFPMQIIEGVAVYTESLTGDGRLNDPRVWEKLIQDKLDGTVWHWNDIERRDTYPSGLFAYLYGGAFADFLTKVYGQQEYYSFLEMHPKWFTNRNFKLKFGKSVQELFDAFLETIPYTEAIEPNFLKNLDGKSLYGGTASYKGFLVFADNNEGAVFKYNLETHKTTKLFSINSTVYNLSVSKNGLLAVSYFYAQGSSTISKVELYDLEKNTFVKESYESLRYGALSLDEKSLVAVKVISQKASLVLVDRKTKKETLLCDSGLEYNNIFQVVPVTENSYAGIFAKGISRDIILIHTNGTTQKLNLPFEVKALGSLSSYQTETSCVLAFSYTTNTLKDLTRFAYYDVNTQELHYLVENISGGTHLPTLVQKEPFKVVAVSKHSTYDKFSLVDTTNLKVARAYFTDIRLTPIQENTEPLNARNYNPIMKMWKPDFKPFINLGNSFLTTAYGLSLSSNDLLNRLAYDFTVALMPYPTFAWLEFIGSLTLGPNTLSISTYDIASVQDKTIGIRQTGVGLYNSVSFMPGIKQVWLSLNSSVNAQWYSFFDPSKVIYTQSYHETVLKTSQSFTVSYFFNRERLGARFFAKDEYGVTNTTNITFAVQFPEKEPGFMVQNLLTAKLPVVPLTMELSLAYTYNTFYSPVSGMYRFVKPNTRAGVSGAVLPDMASHAEYFTLKRPTIKNHFYIGFTGTLRVFSVEIQKSSAWLPFCFNRVNIDLGGSILFGALEKPNMLFLTSAFVSATVEISDAATLGVSYTQPILKGVGMGSFDLIIDISL